MDWDDLRFVLAVGRQGGLSGAARQLAVNHATVYRRIGQIEAKLGVQLFTRHREGYSPTPAGDEAIDAAGDLENRIDDLLRAIAGRDARPSGPVRLTTTDTLMRAVLAPILARFRIDYPDITLEIVIENRFLSLSKRDADIALRPAVRPPETLVGRRICNIASAIYGTSNSFGAARDLADQSWIMPDESLATLASAKWLAKRLKDRPPVAQANSLLGLCDLAEAGLGLAILPCFLGDSAPELQRIGQPDDDWASELWLLTHRDLRRVTRIRAVLDYLATALRAENDRFEGRKPTPTKNAV